MVTSNKKTPRKRKVSAGGSDVRMSKDDSMAQIMDKIVQTVKDPGQIRKVLSKEAAKRGVKVPTIGMLRSHIRYRQARGHLTGIRLPEARS